jgi:hypothetical protein
MKMTMTMKMNTNMKKSVLSLVLPLLAAFAIPAVAQAACSVATPCTTVSITNSTMSATVVTNAQGIQTSGPGTATVYRCIGSASCTPALLAAFIAAPTSPSAWIVSGTVPQTSNTASFTDTSAAYGAMLNYAVANSWTGGGTSAPSSPFVIVMPAAPATAPGSPTVTVVLKTS